MGAQSRLKMQNAKCKIRKFSPSDLKEIRKIEKASFPNQKAWSKKYFEKIYQKYPKEFLVAKSEPRRKASSFLRGRGKIAGFVIGQKNKKEAKIISLAVVPKVRKKGIGTILIKFLINLFKKEGVKKISLHTRTKNKIGILFFKKLDFEISQKIKNYYQNGDDAFLMERKI